MKPNEKYLGKIYFQALFLRACNLAELSCGWETVNDL